MRRRREDQERLEREKRMEEAERQRQQWILEQQMIQKHNQMQKQQLLLQQQQLMQQQQQQEQQQRVASSAMSNYPEQPLVKPHPSMARSSSVQKMTPEPPITAQQPVIILKTPKILAPDVIRDELYKNRSSRKVDSRRLFSRE